jgi:hypothetical protein
MRARCVWVRCASACERMRVGWWANAACLGAGRRRRFCSAHGAAAPVDPLVHQASPKDAPPGYIRCWDPATMQDLGAVKAFSKEDVLAAVARAKAAQAHAHVTSAMRACARANTRARAHNLHARVHAHTRACLRVSARFGDL